MTDLPDHLEPVDDPHHTARCCVCGRVVTIGPTSDIEYGHQRGYNNDSARLQTRCPHRPEGVDPDKSGRGGHNG